jgi:NADPH-dependent 2,4-dienoyl-CoA reductase/sulfur reductase-like enzyme
MVDPAPLPLVPAVGAELAQVLHSMHAAHGVDVRVGTPRKVVADGKNLLVDVEQRDGLERLAADVVLVAIGIEADTTLAASAGLAVGEGVEVDQAGGTSHPAIRAAGDGIRLRDADGRLHRRSEHWEAAMLSGTAAACGIIGQPAPERPPAWFWSDRYGVHVEAVGSMSEPGLTVTRIEGDQHIVFLVGAGGVLLGCAAINGGKTVRQAKRLIVRGDRTDPDLLADPAVDLRKIAR